MKYRLPGIYLGNISLDLFMEYMSNEELSNQVTANDFYQTANRTENIKVFRVDFTYNLVNYNFYTFNIIDTTNIREMIRTYFRDIISSDPDYDTNVDAIVFTVQPTVFIENPVLFDTLGQPSIYGTYMINNMAEYKYMISLKGDAGQDLNSYPLMKQYVDNFGSSPIPVNIYDLRYPTEHLIKTLYVDTETLNNSSVQLIEFVLDINEVVIGTKENLIYFGNRSLLNYIGTDGSFYFRDKLGGLTKSPYKNVMMRDIENNRKILDESIQIKMLSVENSPYFRGICGVVGTQTDSEDKVDLTFAKYDKYNIKKELKKIASIPVEATDVRFEDLEPKIMSSVGDVIGNTHEFDDSSMIVYTDFVNTSNLPKFKAIHKSFNGNNRYYIFDTIRGNVPEFITTELNSDKKTLCLLDVYDKTSIIVKTLSTTKTHALDYNMHYDAELDKYFIFRTIKLGNITYYIKLADNENELTGYVIMVSKERNTFTTASELIDDFQFSDLGINVSQSNVYPLDYEKISGTTVVKKWGLDIQMSENEKLSVELRKVEDGSAEQFSAFMDKTMLNGKVYFKFPITLDIASRPTELIEDVMVTLRTKKIISANDYEFETFGYWATTESNDYSVEPPVFSEYETEETKPYNNISWYTTLNNFTWVPLDVSYSKKYYIVNKYDQSNIYEVTEELKHEGTAHNPYPYNNTFIRVNEKLSSIINRNNINWFREQVGNVITLDSRGKLIDSDIMGTDLIDSLRDEFKRGFNNIFYGIGNYTYNYTLAELDDQDKIMILRNSLVTFDSLNKLLNSFLRYNFVTTNKYLYTIDKNFRMGFFIKSGDRNINVNNLFTNWMLAVPSSAASSDNLNALQKIKEYEKVTSDTDIVNRDRIEWIKNHLLYNNTNGKTTDYVVNKPRNPSLKDINNKDIVSQAFSMLMDQRYNVAKVISSFANTNISNLVIVNTKEKDLFSGSHEQVRFINSNQKIDVMVNSYLNGFTKKVGE